MSIRNKIISLFTTITAAITLLLSILIYLFTAKYLDRDFFQRMTARAGIAGQARFNASENNIDFYNEIREKHLQRLPEEKEYFFDSVTITEIPGVVQLVLTKERNSSLLATGSVRFKNNNTSYVGVVYHQGQLKRSIIL